MSPWIMCSVSCTRTCSSRRTLLPRFCSLFSFVLLCGYTFASHAGAWLQHQGDWMVIDTTTVFRSESYYDSHGRRRAQEAFQKLENSQYIEYGLRENTTIGGSLFWHYLEQNTPQAGGVATDATNIGLADPELFSRHALWQSGGWRVSVQPLIKLPSLYEKEALPQSGSDSLDVESSLLGGYGFSSDGLHHYVDARAGYRHRTDAMLRDQLKLDLKLGYALSEAWQIMPALSATVSTDLPKTPQFTESGQNDYHLLKWECNLVYLSRPDRFYQLGGFMHAAGRNAGAGGGLAFSMGYRF